MAEHKRCKQCNGNFLYTTKENLCLSCSQQKEMEFKRIKHYLKNHPGSSIGNVSTDLDISVTIIQKFIDEGRLEMIDKKFVIDD